MTEIIWLTNGWSFLHAFLSSASRAMAIPDIMAYQYDALCKMGKKTVLNYTDDNYTKNKKLWYHGWHHEAK